MMGRFNQNCSLKKNCQSYGVCQGLCPSLVKNINTMIFCMFHWKTCMHSARAFVCAITRATILGTLVTKLLFTHYSQAATSHSCIFHFGLVFLKAKCPLLNWIKCNIINRLLFQYIPKIYTKNIGVFKHLVNVITFMLVQSDFIKRWTLYLLW